MFILNNQAQQYRSKLCTFIYGLLFSLIPIIMYKKLFFGLILVSKLCENHFFSHESHGKLHENTT